jgi:MFS family permease
MPNVYNYVCFLAKPLTSQVISFASAIGGFLFGYEIGVVDQLFEMRDFGLRFGLVVLDSSSQLLVKTPQNADIRGNITFTFLMGCAFGALCVGALLADSLGRKRSILIGGSCFAIGGLAQAFVSDIALFYTGRVVSGVGIGILSMVVPLYIGETAPTAIRGRMVAIQQLVRILFNYSDGNHWDPFRCCDKYNDTKRGEWE